MTTSIIKTNVNSCENWLCQSISTIILCLIIGLILLLILLLFLSRKKLRKSFSKCRAFLRKSPSGKINDPDEKGAFLINGNHHQQQQNGQINSNEISLGKFLKSGRFSQIYQGIYHGENIAIKMLTSTDSNDEARISFEHEKSIYSQPFMDHQNLLKYFLRF